MSDWTPHGPPPGPLGRTEAAEPLDFQDAWRLGALGGKPSWGPRAAGSARLSASETASMCLLRADPDHELAPPPPSACPAPGTPPGLSLQHGHVPSTRIAPGTLQSAEPNRLRPKLLLLPVCAFILVLSVSLFLSHVVSAMMATHVLKVPTACPVTHTEGWLAASPAAGPAVAPVCGTCPQTCLRAEPVAGAAFCLSWSRLPPVSRAPASICSVRQEAPGEQAGARGLASCSRCPGPAPKRAGRGVPDSPQLRFLPQVSSGSLSPHRV